MAGATNRQFNGKHADGGFLDAECTSFASYDND